MIFAVRRGGPSICRATAFASHSRRSAGIHAVIAMPMTNSIESGPLRIMQYGTDCRFWNTN